MESDHPPARDLVPNSFAKEHRIVPLGWENGILRVGAARPKQETLADELAFLTGSQVQWEEIEPSEIETFFEEKGLEESSSSAEENRGVDTEGAFGSKEGAGEKPLGAGSVVQQIERIIHRAIEEGASDIHIEPYESFFRVRYRIDGVLHTVGELDLAQRDATVSRIKIMAGLDIAEKRRPQDSRIRVEHEGRSVDLRVSTLPTAHGEKAVLRVLDKSALTLDLGALGLGEEEEARFEEAIGSPNGQILVTGPTGSGKTTTLYTALDALNTEKVNITTIEDPIEYNLKGINQTQVRGEIGFSFAEALRAFLRQDPNIVMVGEIRDQETADIAVRAALTGHLVLSTLHTNDAPSTVTRLVDMGVEPYLVASSVRLVAAQRLVRTVCPSCKASANPDPALLEKLGLPPSANVVAGEGCLQCSGTGFQGRTGLFELMPLSEEIGELVTSGASTADIRDQAKAEGMNTLREAGAKKIREGVTTPSEVLRETAA